MSIIICLITWCNHNPTNQKGHRIRKENSQNWINIYVLPFKAMAIMACYCIFIHMNLKEFKPKIHLMSLSFDLKPLKVNNNLLDKNQFCKENYQKNSYNKTHLMRKNLRG